MATDKDADSPELMAKCVRAHDRCDGGPCPYCEPVWPLRDTRGRFAPHAPFIAEQADFSA